MRALGRQAAGQVDRYLLMLQVRQAYALYSDTGRQTDIQVGNRQELCESRGGRPGLSVLTSLLASVDVKIY